MNHVIFIVLVAGVCVLDKRPCVSPR
jgi:hypothetical protein